MGQRIEQKVRLDLRLHDLQMCLDHLRLETMPLELRFAQSGGAPFRSLDEVVCRDHHAPFERVDAEPVKELAEGGNARIKDPRTFQERHRATENERHRQDDRPRRPAGKGVREHDRADQHEQAGQSARQEPGPIDSACPVRSQNDFLDVERHGDERDVTKEIPGQTA